MMRNQIIMKRIMIKRTNRIKRRNKLQKKLINN